MKFREKINVHILHQKSFLSVLLEGEHSFKTKPGEIISLYGIYEKTTITTKGLKYTLNNEPLPFGTRDGTSNEAVDEEITVDVNGGKIFLIREFEVLKENGFLYSR
jgi:thiamine pyrophosphokinase